MVFFETALLICFTFSLHEFSVLLMYSIIYYFSHFSGDTDPRAIRNWPFSSYDLGLKYDKKKVKIVNVSNCITKGVLNNKAYSIQ